MNHEHTRSTPRAQPKKRDGASSHQDSGAQSHQSNLAKQLDPADKLLPHERDQAPDANEVPPDTRAPIRQAQTDVMRGLRDTGRRGTPSDVPAGDAPTGSGGKHEKSATKKLHTSEQDDTGMAPPESEVDMSDRPPGARR